MQSVSPVPFPINSHPSSIKKTLNCLPLPIPFFAPQNPPTHLQILQILSRYISSSLNR
ncbi:hypothetical protein HanPSC8_Chr02g0062711 [Helianthus annuus]|nr:hypothetical protein HanIR_Chr02g0071031 [Helianthus annuus]KAJ0951648.1 hypothetical protein HanPSC8_Chr02g0062711 [Helianthus annuus]